MFACTCLLLLRMLKARTLKVLHIARPLFYWIVYTSMIIHSIRVTITIIVTHALFFQLPTAGRAVPLNLVDGVGTDLPGTLWACRVLSCASSCGLRRAAIFSNHRLLPCLDTFTSTFDITVVESCININRVCLLHVASLHKSACSISSPLVESSFLSTRTSILSRCTIIYFVQFKYEFAFLPIYSSESSRSLPSRTHKGIMYKNN